jgi:hypothetical protein
LKIYLCYFLVINRKKLLGREKTGREKREDGEREERRWGERREKMSR